ncbi:excinuclease ABC subunit UvrB [bacterium]|nr:excinuclease ABC subunit UvrB [bacterium]
MPPFKVHADFAPSGDQPSAIEEMAEGLLAGEDRVTLLGATGTGKTFTIAHAVERIQKPTLVIAPNKSLAAQLTNEFREFFPENAVEYFVSYYDYYQPEAYVPQTDTYIEKDSSVNDEIERLRHSATAALLSREDVLIVASVSCIYGLGTPEEYMGQVLRVIQGVPMDHDFAIQRLVDIHYTRNDFEFARGTFRVRGDVVEVLPADDEQALRVELFGDEVEALSVSHTLTGEVVEEKGRAAIYPAKHFVTTGQKIEAACFDIEKELHERVEWFKSQGKLLEAQRLEMRTRYDMEMMREIGYCSGIENYSRYLDGRSPGSPPHVLIDYFPEEYLLIIDESHVTVPQVRGMWAGDRSRKDILIEHGFRLPSAYDNRPLFFEEFEQKAHQGIFMSATPADYELEKSRGVVVEQIIRPTGLLDPQITVKPARGQVDDLLEEVRARVERKERVLVTTLTKRMSEDLTDYMREMGVRVRYLHSEIESLDRVDTLRDLRLGEFDVLVGVNLLREGLDLPEVSLVAILDADKEGFLRSERSLIQTAGRAARHLAGEVILYADKRTDAIRKAVSETNRRREIQQRYNEEHGITPQSIVKSVEEVMLATSVADARREAKVAEPAPAYETEDVVDLIAQLEKKMKRAASSLEFEEAARLRDEIARLKARMAAGGK